MTPEQTQQQIRDIFESVIRLEPEARELYLLAVCRDNQTLLQEVQSLIAAELSKATVAVPLDNKQTLPLADGAMPALSHYALASPQQRRIGAYQILDELGTGGMGSVYLAARADDEFEHRVAIKVVKSGMDSDFVIRRFRNERQILANLNHPNVARLIDGGTTEDGLPYFVMEYVEGQPILDYCDNHKLGTTERLKIFRKVCAAIHYSHQNLIVHRDIKPSNILVPEDGEPKLLDFGIAKLLASTGQPIDTTQQNARLMTPAYASPEQARGESVTTATDIYSLGVLLYELLTGFRPYRLPTSSLADMMKVICEQEPVKPSTIISRKDTQDDVDTVAQQRLTWEDVSKLRDVRPEQLRRELSGDLDNIVLKAMRKEPQHRYPSAEQFSEDIRRFLEGLPVTASEGTFRYRAGKFIRLHRAAVIAATLIVLTLIAGIIGTTWQAMVARRERVKAEKRFQDVRKLANSFLFEFHDSIQNLQGATPARELVVKRALEYLDSLAQEAGNDASLKRELATAYHKVGDVQGDPYGASLGDTDSALDSYRKALAIRERLSAANPGDKEVRREMAASQLKVGDILWVQGDWNGALEIYQRAQAIYKDLAAAAPDNIDLAYDLSGAHQAIGDTLQQMGNLPEALENQRQCLAIREALSQKSNDTKIRLGHATSYIKIGDVLTQSGNMADCLDNYNKGIAMLEELAKAEPTNAKVKRVLKSSYQRLGMATEKVGNEKKAIEIYKNLIATDVKGVADDPADAVAKRDLLGDYLSLANAYSMNGAGSESLTYYEKSLALAVSLSEADPNNTQAQNDLLAVRMELGRTLEESKKLAEAEKYYRQAVALAETLLVANQNNASSQTDLARCYLRLGRIRAQLGDEEESLKLLNKSLELREARASADPSNADAQYDLAGAYFFVGFGHEQLATSKNKSASQRLTHWQEARNWYQRSLDLYIKMRDSGILAESRVADIDDNIKQIAKCDRAIQQLKSAK